MQCHAAFAHVCFEERRGLHYKLLKVKDFSLNLHVYNFLIKAERAVYLLLWMTTVKVSRVVFSHAVQSSSASRKQIANYNR